MSLAFSITKLSCYFMYFSLVFVIVIVYCLFVILCIYLLYMLLLSFICYFMYLSLVYVIVIVYLLFYVFFSCICYCYCLLFICYFMYLSPVYVIVIVYLLFYVFISCICYCYCLFVILCIYLLFIPIQHFYSISLSRLVSLFVRLVCSFNVGVGRQVSVSANSVFTGICNQQLVVKILYPPPPCL